MGNIGVFFFLRGGFKQRVVRGYSLRGTSLGSLGTAAQAELCALPSHQGERLGKALRWGFLLLTIYAALLWFGVLYLNTFLGSGFLL